MKPNPLLIGTATRGLSLRLDTYIEPSARERHTYIIGQTGTGKSALLLNLAAQDLVHGEGLAFIDPHGSTAEQLLTQLPTKRARDLIYLTPDSPRPIGLTFTTGIKPESRSLATEAILSAFLHIWGENAIGARSQQVLRNSLRLIMDANQNLLAIPKLLNDETYRAMLLKTLDDPVVSSYWTNQYARYDDRFRNEVISPILNKLDAFLGVPTLRNILCQPSNTVDLRRLMDEGKILIVNLSKGRLGEAPAHLLGALLVSALMTTAFSRHDTPEERRRPFHIYADEFQNFATDSFSLVLSEARKYRLSLTLAHQFLAQVPESIRHAVLGNAASLIAFRIGADDAPLIAQQFDLETPQAFQNLSNFTALYRTLEDGSPSTPQLIATFRPPRPLHTRVRQYIDASAQRFGRDRAKIEAGIGRFLKVS